MPSTPELGDVPRQIEGLASRFHLPALARHADRRRVVSVVVMVNAAVATATLCGIAAVTHEPFMFPSLGPTAFVLLFAPLALEASPRNVFCGHLIGVLAGSLALLAFGLASAPPDLDQITWQRAGAVTMALALTLGVMVWLGVPHAPAAATTLIVALGLIHEPAHLVVLMAAVVLLIVEGYAINRLAGLPVPIWAPHDQGRTGRA